MTKKRKKTLKPGKEITASKTDNLAKKLNKIPDGEIKELVMDFSNVLVVDAVGLGLILATRNTLADQQGHLRLINVSEELFNMFHIMKMDEIINIEFKGESR